MNCPREVELKLECAPADVAVLRAAVLQMGAGLPDRRLIATYFDTADRAIQQAGYTLRIRDDGDGPLQTVKSDRPGAGLFDRGEWEQPVDGGRPKLGKRSGPLANLLRKATRRAVAPLFRIDVTRTISTITSGHTIIECAIDAGQARAGNRQLAICECELELVSGDPQALFTLARELNAVVPLRIGVQSKAERGYQLAQGRVTGAVKAGRVRLDRAGTVADAFAAVAQNCVRQFRLNEARLLASNGVEPLHQARVGIRRLRSAFSLFKPLFKHDPQADVLRQGLKRLAAALGDVRNLDVLLPHLARSDRDRVIIARRRAMADARMELMSVRTRALMIDLAEWLALGAWRLAPADATFANGPVVPLANQVLRTRRKQLVRHGRRLVSLDDDQRHQVRIEAKKLRYAAEFFASLYPARKRQRRRKLFGRALEDLQNQLGALNDAAIGQDILSALHINARPGELSDRRRRRTLDGAAGSLDRLADSKRFWRKQA